ncbi:DUF1613-domain-containing protein, partial [Rhizodiscina lignyota]
WLSILSHDCAFPPPIFLKVLENLIRNPNISSSLLFRAEIFYDSEKDTTIVEAPDLDARQETPFSSFTKHLKSDYRPRGTQIPPGYVWQRTLVRRLVPRNPQLDRDLVQTVHFFRSSNDPSDSAEANFLILQIPHVDKVDDIPFYHPAVKSIALIYTWAGGISQPQPGNISIHYNLFEGTDTSALSNRLIRTAHHLVQIIYKHGQGQLAGYTKRVHHDLVIPQKRFQDTYTRLKIKYAKDLVKDWREQTDPTKHVFEDLGIAAFLLELWHDMYGDQEFPGFVDIGCGNGVLVHILMSEGYQGWGFDARRRKSWDMFPEAVQGNLKEVLLVPKVLQTAAGFNESDSMPINGTAFHDGHFQNGTFIISNHADELTPWTPLLASLSSSPFIAIPCCSHNFSGARFRAPNKANQPSAYATLTSWVAKLAVDSGCVPEKEMLRIPSTRNAAVIGR